MTPAPDYFVSQTVVENPEKKDCVHTDNYDDYLLRVIFYF